MIAILIRVFPTTVIWQSCSISWLSQGENAIQSTSKPFWAAVSSRNDHIWIHCDAAWRSSFTVCCFLSFLFLKFEDILFLIESSCDVLSVFWNLYEIPCPIQLWPGKGGMSPCYVLKFVTLLLSVFFAWGGGTLVSIYIFWMMKKCWWWNVFRGIAHFLVDDVGVSFRYLFLAENWRSGKEQGKRRWLSLFHRGNSEYHGFLLLGRVQI